MSFLDTPQMRLMERYLDLTTERQGLLSANIANIDTPGYRTRDIDFHGELMRAQQDAPDGPTEPLVKEVPGLIARPDGNNVSVDREGLLLSQVQLQFSEVTQLVKDQFRMISMAIDKGGS
jgi:flagellar basal-body rod protein FlgB